MATKYWLGTATAVAQVGTVQVTAYHASTTYSLLVGGVTIASTIGQGTVNATASALATAWNASTHPYATGITAAANTDTVTLTADTAGVPFTVTTSVSGGTGTIGSYSATTASAGPSDWSTASNWSDGSVPGNGDTVIVRDSDVNVAYGLTVSATGLILRVEYSYTGRIGLDRKVFATSADGETTNTTKAEYREDYLTADFASIEIGANLGISTSGGSGRIKIDNTRSSSSTLVVHNTAASPVETNLPAVRYKAAHASADVFVRAAPAGVGIAVDIPGETSTVGTVAVDDDSRTTSVFVGEGVTITTFRQRGGDNLLNAAGTITTVDCLGGTLQIEGDYTITTLNVEGGTCLDNHVKTGGNAITTANIDGGTLDSTRTTRTRTWATVNLTSGQLKADSDYLTITTLNDPAGPYSLTAVSA